MANYKKIMTLALALGVVLMGLLVIVSVQSIDADPDYTSEKDIFNDNLLNEAFKFLKNIGIWFMLMLVAFLMIFIKKFEWGVCLAVLLSAASSYIVYAAIWQFVFDSAWNQDLLIGAVLCAITYVIAIGVFLGTVKQWMYFAIGIGFAVFYSIGVWLLSNFTFNDVYATDPGGSIVVHMCAAYFGLGVCLALRVKSAFNEPMHVTTHSVSLVWLASMLLWVLWPTFVCALLPMEDFAWGTMTCYMAGLGSIVSAYVVCMVLQKKVNPLTYTYAMLAGPVAIGAPLITIGPWEALLLGLFAGALSAACFICLQPRLCKKLGVLDVMGVHNLHGMAGWTGALACAIALLILGHTDGAIANVLLAGMVFCIALGGGFLTGFIVKLLDRKPMAEEDMFNDDYDFIRVDCPDEIAKL